MGIFVGVRIELFRTVRARVQQLSRMRGHVFLQHNRPFKLLIAEGALQFLRCVNILLVRLHPFLAIELATTNIAVVSFVLLLVPHHVVLQGVAVLVLAATQFTLETGGCYGQMLVLMRRKSCIV